MKDKKEIIVFSLFAAVVVLSIFWRFVFSDAVLMATDPVVSSSDMSFSELLYRHFGFWRDWVLLGNGYPSTTLQLPMILKGLLPAILWNNISYGIACLLASVFLWRFFRRKLTVFSALLGCLVGFWTGSNFTLLYAGHTAKPYIVFLFVCSLIPAAGAAAGSIFYALIWGCCIGLMFIQQPDVAMFFALFAGAYLIFRLWQGRRFRPSFLLKILLPAAIVALLFAVGPLLNGYTRFVKGAAQMQSGNRQDKWDYVTQWSFPPEEIIDFVAPGYTGWRSGEPEGPYWGRMGRSPGWEQTKQGFQNFKLESTYLGVIPVAFALFALFSCRRSKHRGEILFWGGAMVVALLLSFGKFFPLYSLFYKLPVVNNIRNPNKFLQVFQVCLAILTAYGFDALWCSREYGAENLETGLKSNIQSPKFSVKPFFWIMVGVLGIFGFWALSLSVNSSSDVSGFAAQGWPQSAAEVIVRNKISALWHASFMAAVVIVVFALFSFPRFGKILKFKSWIAAGLVLIVVVDVVKLSKHYVKEMPRCYIGSNALTDFLKKGLGNQRVALLSQQGIYNIWTTYLLPYNRIPTFNFSDMPRMATDYKTFLEEGQRNPLNMWRFSAVKYLLGPTSVEKQLVGQARKVFSYDLAPVKNGGFKVIPAMTGQHAVFELLNTYPRYAVIAPIGPVSDKQALISATQLPRPQVGSAEVLSYRPGKVKLRVTENSPAMLRVAEKWDAAWKAEVDGNSADVQRVDYICQGVSVPAGEHEVILRYAPSKRFFYIQCTGYLILFVSLGVVWIKRKDRHVAN